MLKTSIYLIATVSLLTFSVSKATEVILEDTPNVGDTTTITTVTTGNPVTTGNLISQQFNDGSWVGTMFPDSSDINESTWLTGKHGKYAETTINSEDHLTLPELQAGFTSTFGAQIRWWNPVESTVTLTQTATNGIDTTTQSTTFVDTTNHNYQVNPYSNQLTLSPDSQNQHGTLTLRFSFDIQGNKNYNGGHAGVDVRDPYVNVEYNTLSTTQSTSVVYCWQKNPPTCPGQDEIEDVQEQLEQFDLLEFTIPDDIFTEPPPEIEYTFVPIFEEEVIEIEEFYEMPMDNFFFEPEYYEEVVMEEFIPVDVVMVEELDWNDYQPLTQFMFHSAKSSLDKIGKIHAIERTLYSEYLGLAGRVDCIAEYDGGLAVIDFKTSKKIKPEEWIEQYFVQEVAYACMYYELTGIPIQKLITIMVTPNGEVKVYDKRNKGDYIKLLVKYVKEFIKNRMVVNG